MSEAENSIYICCVVDALNLDELYFLKAITVALKGTPLDSLRVRDTEAEINDKISAQTGEVFASCDRQDLVQRWLDRVRDKDVKLP